MAEHTNTPWFRLYKWSDRLVWFASGAYVGGIIHDDVRLRALASIAALLGVVGILSAAWKQGGRRHG